MKVLSSLGQRLFASTPAQAERRRHPRFVSLSHATIAGEDGLISHCLVQDLSLSGAQIVGGIQLVIGELVRLSMQLPGRLPITLDGRVVRRLGGLEQSGRWGEQTFAFGISFLRVPRGAQQALHAGIATRPQQLGDHGLVLVVDGSSAACAWAVGELGRLGRQAIAVTNALDAIEWLLDDSQHFELALINIAQPAADGLSLWLYLGEAHTQVRRLTYGELAADALPAGIDPSCHVAQALTGNRLETLVMASVAAKKAP